MQQPTFGKWAFAGIVVIVGYEVIDTLAPAYRNLYLAALLLSVTLFYFGAKPTGAKLPQQRQPGQPF